MTVDELLNTDSDKVRIFIVRHGQTPWNNIKKCQGHTNIGLNEKGYQQAELIGERLKDFKIDEFISSDLTRCVETMNQITKHHGVSEYRKTPQLRERFMGPVEGMFLKDALEKYGVNFKDLGETKKELVIRLSKEWDEILKDSFNKGNRNVVLCSHGGAITNLMQSLYYDRDYQLGEGLIPESLNVPFNTSLTVVEVSQDGKGLIERFGCTKHLGTEVEAVDQDLR
ncbi:hypothetical protein CANARDRAFT_8182 [[Candida] arabinofermentans NRRL YB-2248]|uniref:Phosphoglycerate mutase n=1 Tax=[Candida] arabinofermentans NRRL YB-2248 TaxID=983967 RepID=A0A1E4SZZ2_9ASCO|nr:hypothetical protein CANARDRAFT_8182 [[Candida] arabinofermentans NRRL YB-2248]